MAKVVSRRPTTGGWNDMGLGDVVVVVLAAVFDFKSAFAGRSEPGASFLLVVSDAYRIVSVRRERDCEDERRRGKRVSGAMMARLREMRIECDAFVIHDGCRMGEYALTLMDVEGKRESLEAARLVLPK